MKNNPPQWEMHDFKLRIEKLEKSSGGGDNGDMDGWKLSVESRLSELQGLCAGINHRLGLIETDLRKIDEKFDKKFDRLTYLIITILVGVVALIVRAFTQ